MSRIRYFLQLPCDNAALVTLVADLKYLQSDDDRIHRNDEEVDQEPGPSVLRSWSPKAKTEMKIGKFKHVLSKFGKFKLLYLWYVCLNF
jgi:hypothetical protein